MEQSPLQYKTKLPTTFGCSLPWRKPQEDDNFALIENFWLQHKPIDVKVLKKFGIDTCSMQHYNSGKNFG